MHIATQIGEASASDSRRMEVQEPAKAFASVVEAVLCIRPLIDVLQQPVRAAFSDGERTPAPIGNHPKREDLVNSIAHSIGAPRLVWAGNDAAPTFTVFERAISARLNACDAANYEAALAHEQSASQIIEQVLRQSFDSKFNRETITSFDGARVSAYSGGDRRRNAVIMVCPCGMPAKICEKWMDALARNYFVIVWESRALLGDLGHGDAIASDVNAQVEDLFAVMRHFELKTVHLVGLCGGAVVAITAAAMQPERISSLSIWHGDFELGGACPKTTHQQNLKALMSMAAAGRAEAQAIHAQFCQSVRTSARSHLDHLVLYPFANPELLWRYGKLNGNIMSTNVMPLLDKVVQPTLVVTSEDDVTAHPEGSRFIAARIAKASLHVEAHGDHLSLFDADANITGLAAQFIEQQRIER